MRSFFLILITLAFPLLSTAQRFYSVVFDELPKDMQLYARNDDNIAEIPVSGIIEVAGWDHMSLVTLRNNARVDYQKAALTYGDKTIAAFSMVSEIKAEMADYSFEVYACHKQDSVLIVRRDEVVAGDFFVISGQSNAAATIFGSWSSKYCRTIARTPDGDPSILPGDTLWTNAAWSWTYVGAWGLELQKNILENDSIPTCVINGSLPGKKIAEFIVRDAANPASFTLYGSLLKRVRVAGATRIKAFIWMHGEQEVFENIDNYAAQYDILYNYWRQDYPEIDQFLVVQTNLIILRNDIPNPVGGATRDFLRRTQYLYPQTDHFSSIGTPGWDGVHYDRPGYEEFGRRLYRFLAPTLYGSNDTDNVRSPDIKRAFYSSAEKDQIILVFDEGQNLKWAADSTVIGQDGKPLVLSLKDFFYLDGEEKNPAFKAGRAEGNRVTLDLKAPSKAVKISYLPSFYPDNLPLIEPFSFNIAILTGPFIRNKRGLGAFSFDNVTIGQILPDVDLTAAKASNSVILSWKTVEGASHYTIEKKDQETGQYRLLAQLEAGILTYEDKDLEVNRLQTYRIQAVSAISESPYATADVDYTPILSVEEDDKKKLWQVYQNPIEDVLKIKFGDLSSGIIKVYSSTGQSYLRTSFHVLNFWEFNVGHWPSGLYLINIELKDGYSSTQKFVKR